MNYTEIFKQAGFFGKMFSFAKPFLKTVPGVGSGIAAMDFMKSFSRKTAPKITQNAARSIPAITTQIGTKQLNNFGRMTNAYNRIHLF